MLSVFLIVYSVYQLFSELSKGRTGELYFLWAVCGFVTLVRFWGRKE